MCGISGIINKNNSQVEIGKIAAMNNLIFHRGPDSEDYFFFKNFAFGHRRLSIIDLSDSASQPMSYNGRYTIVYNGEIYNYIEIRNDLKNLNYRFNTESDTEVILAAYDYYGIDCVKKFNGMWAFALFDHLKEIIFCSRDRFGVKPFYYSDDGDNFIFGSEIKQLLLFQKKCKANLPIIVDYLVSGFEDHSNDTFFQNVKKLEQSHNLIFDLHKNSFYISRYFELQPDESLRNLNETESSHLYFDLLCDSIRLRLRSDVKVGTCLSGGLDSSSVASIAATMYKNISSEKFTSITAKSSDPVLDETSFAEKVVRKFDLNWLISSPTGIDFANKIEDLIRIQEEPFGSPSVFMQYKVFEKAREAGCIVMLDGQGGDETLLGYERYFPAYILSLTREKMLKGFISSYKNSRLSPLELLSYMIYFTNPWIRIKRLQSKNWFLKKAAFSYLNEEIIRSSSRSYKNIMDLQMQELMTIQLPHLLKYEDRNSMAHSIESRLPFIDYRLVETALSINDRFKIKDGWTKYLLRKTMIGILPEEIVWRRDKLGFNAPESVWMQPLIKQFKNQINDSNILNVLTKREYLIKSYDKLDLRSQWRFFNLAKWEELFNVHTS